MTMTEKYAVINFRRCLRCNIRNYINRGVSLENNDAVINIGGKRHWSQHKTTWPCITSPRERFSLMCEMEIEDQAKNVSFLWKYENNIIHNIIIVILI